MGRPKGSRNVGSQQDNLEAFARRIEIRVKQAGIKGQETIELLVCRVISSYQKNPAVAGMLLSKWVEWRYGKAKETVKIEGEIKHEHFRSVNDEELARFRELAERVYIRSNTGRELPS